MRRKWLVFLTISFILVILITCSKKDDFPLLKGPYLGQKPPGMKPELFAPGIISTGFSENIVFFTNGGKELYYYLRGAPFSVIVCMKEENGQWTKPKVAPFSGQYSGEFCLSPDGNTVVMDTRMPFSRKGEALSYNNMWIVKRTAYGWTEPQIIKTLENSGGYPSLANNGNLYFFDTRDDCFGKMDIYVSKYINGRYAEPENLGSSINSGYTELDAFIAPDESYIIFGSDRPDGFGNGDNFISYRLKDGTWSKAVNMGESVNSDAVDYCPSVTPDGKYFFFASTRKTFQSYSEKSITYKEKIRILNSPGNGSSDIYWVDAKIIEDLKPAHLK